MKRIVILTTALMFAGMTSLSLAHENMDSGKSSPSVESKPAASTAPAEAKPAANVESAKQPMAMHGKKKASLSKRGTGVSQKVAQGSPAVTEKPAGTKKKETSTTTTPESKVAQGNPAVTEKPAETKKKETSTTTTPESKEKKTEQKPNEAPATTNPTK